MELYCWNDAICSGQLVAQLWVEMPHQFICEKFPALKCLSENRQVTCIGPHELQWRNFHNMPRCWWYTYSEQKQSQMQKSANYYANDEV